MQTRGSAPLFWEQKGKAVSALNGRPRLSRAMELTLPALRRHLAQQADVYGAPLLLSLLGQKGDDEVARCKCIVAKIKVEVIAHMVMPLTVTWASLLLLGSPRMMYSIEVWASVLCRRFGGEIVLEGRACGGPAHRVYEGENGCIHETVKLDE